MLDSHPSEARLQELVRCAAMELDSMGYFASVSLANDPRWKSGSIYLFGLDTYGYTLFTGSPANPLIGSELSSDYIGNFAGRNILGVADAFGESFLYYWNRNPGTNQWQRKVTFVKRVTSFGVPVLIGAGYYLESPVPSMNGAQSGELNRTAQPAGSANRRCSGCRTARGAAPPPLHSLRNPNESSRAGAPAVPAAVRPNPGRRGRLMNAGSRRK